MGRKISRVYYSSKGFWKGLPLFKKLTKEARMSEDVADEISHLVDLFACLEAYPETKF